MIIACDSSADLRTEEPYLYSVPLKIITDTREFIDNNELDVSKMTEFLSSYKGKSSTACPSVADWLDAFKGDDEIFAVTITSNLSGSYNAARLAKDEYEKKNPGCRVHVIDSLSAGPELKLIVEKIKELYDKKFSFDEIKTKLEGYKTGLLFSLESLKNLANNGRVSKVTAKLAGVLGIRIVGKASIRGDLEPLSKSRGEAKALSEILSKLSENGYRGGKVIIDHCNNETAALKLKEMIKENFPFADIKTAVTYGLCSFYAEDGGMLIGFEC